LQALSGQPVGWAIPLTSSAPGLAAAVGAAALCWEYTASSLLPSTSGSRRACANLPRFSRSAAVSAPARRSKLLPNP
jgi:hypothetical protein